MRIPIALCSASLAVGLMLLGGSLRTVARFHGIPTESKKKMTQLHIALQIGFSNDTVEIEVDGQKVFSKTGVTTPSHAGLADSIDVTVSEGTCQVLVTILTRQASSTIQLTVSGPTYLGVLLSPDGKITHQVSTRPFAYM